MRAAADRRYGTRCGQGNPSPGEGLGGRSGQPVPGPPAAVAVSAASGMQCRAGPGRRRSQACRADPSAGGTHACPPSCPSDAAGNTLMRCGSDVRSTGSVCLLAAAAPVCPPTPPPRPAAPPPACRCAADCHPALTRPCLRSFNLAGVLRLCATVGPARSSSLFHAWLMTHGAWCWAGFWAGGRHNSLRPPVCA